MISIMNLCLEPMNKFGIQFWNLTLNLLLWTRLPYQTRRLSFYSTSDRVGLKLYINWFLSGHSSMINHITDYWVQKQDCCAGCGAYPSRWREGLPLPTYHVSHVTCHLTSLDKVVKLVGGRSVINRAYPI